MHRRLVVSSFALLAACSQGTDYPWAEGSTIAAISPEGERLHAPPSALTVTVPAMVVGEVVDIGVAGALAGESVVVTASSRGTGKGPCPSALGGMCLTLRSPTVVGTVVTDAAGDGSLGLVVPDVAGLCFQPVVRRGPSGSDSEIGAHVCDYITSAPCDEVDWYADLDRDGYGDSDTLVVSCTDPGGYVTVAGDCDDTDATAYPGAPEVCGDGVPNDCSLRVASCTGLTDADADIWFHTTVSTTNFGAHHSTRLVDLDGDGFDDLVAGADGSAGDHNAYWFFGPFVDAEYDDTDPMLSKITGIDGVNVSVLEAGGLVGIGGPNEDDDGVGEEDKGAAYILRDLTDTPVTSLGIDVGGTALVTSARIVGDVDTPRFGSRVAMGDFDGLNGPDAYFSNHPEGGTGVMWLAPLPSGQLGYVDDPPGKKIFFSGLPAGGGAWWVDLIDLESPSGETPTDDLVLLAVNGDADELWILFGASYDDDTTVVVTEAAVDGNAIRILGPADGDDLLAAYGVGDFNGDGVNDLAVGSRKQVWLLYGPLVVADHDSRVTSLVRAHTHFFDSGAATDALGSHLGRVGDLNGDGMDELVIADTGRGAAGNGRVYVVMGSAALPTSVDLADVGSPAVPGLVIDGSGDAAQLGYSMHGGDADGDGNRDLLVGSGNGNVWIFRGPFPILCCDGGAL